MNPQSHGSVRLSSASPTAPPVVDPNLIGHAYDRRVLIEAVRTLMKLLSAPVFAQSAVKLIGCPKSASDEDIWEHCKGNMFSSW